MIKAAQKETTMWFTQVPERPVETPETWDEQQKRIARLNRMENDLGDSPVEY